LEQFNVLVVDDAVVNVRIIIDILERENYKLFSSNNGAKALEIIKNNQIDLILLDVIMPGMDGFEVAKHLLNDPIHKEIPIIFITSLNNTENIKKCFELGAKDYISKPFNEIELLSRVSTHLELAKNKKNLQHTLDENITLLSQYKTIVDKSSIVSKTDRKGIITYANEAFADISGYSLNELIGKSHNIVRHPDMSKNDFFQMWDTIRNKRIWQGEVKNLKKNGDTYVVLSTAMPILDLDGEIQEYMSVRHDITDIYNLKKEIEDTQKEIIFTMGSIGETRSKETGFHVKRVAEYSRLLGKYAGLDNNEIELLVQASPMHDIGKIAISDSILHKPAKLNDEEFAIMRTHSELGYKMLCHSTRPLLKVAATIAFEHHERWDGQGYPRHLKKDEISIYGRITALADVFDALASNRCYKEAWKDEDIFEYFKEQSGKQFDPNLVEIFFEHIDDFLEVRETFIDI
jgi:PAS domain S-box-containing protein